MKPTPADKKDHAPARPKDGKSAAASAGTAEKPARPSRSASAGKEGGKSAATGEAPKNSRVALLKVRHEAMKRELDQIREDLESEEVE